METINGHISEAEKNVLKQKAMQYMPRNLGDMEAQRQILQMVAEAVPAVVSCIIQADAQIWPKVTSQELPISQAVIQCAYRTEQIISSTYPNDAELEMLSEETLLQAWVALNYYAYVLKTEYSVNIRSVQNKISLILTKGINNGVQKDIAPDPLPGFETEFIGSKVENYGATQPADKVEDYGATQPADKVEDYGATQPVGKVEDYGATQPADKVVAWNSTQQSSKVQTTSANGQVNRNGNAEQTKKRSGAKKLLLIAALALAIVACLSFAFSKTRETQKAIDSIGTVTMESGDAIVYAEQLYEALPDSKQEQVENYQILVKARKEYDRLNTAVKKASDAIDAIGTVTLDSGTKIEAARKAYDALKKDNLQSYVSNKAAILAKAESDYAQCVSDDIYNTGIALYEEGSYEAAIEMFDCIVSDYTQTSNVSNAKSARADCQIAMAEAAYRKSDKYTAMKLLNAVDPMYQSSDAYQNIHTKVMNLLNSTRPNTGYVIDGRIDWGHCYVEVFAPDTDVCVKVQNVEDPSIYQVVYIRAGLSAKINVKDGSYSFKWAAGDYWYDKEHMFGDDTEYWMIHGNTSLTTEYEGYLVTYWYLELELNEANGDVSAISAKDFW